MEQKEATSEQKPRRRGRPRVPGHIEDKIKEYALIGWTPPQIHQQLAVDFPNIKPLPVLKTVRLIAKPYRPSKYWNLAEADPDDAALVLPVLATAVAERRMVLPMSAEIAGWIVRVCRAARNIPPSWALDAALDYAWRTQDKLAVDGLDLLLAFRPWESDEHYLQYLQVVKQMRPDYFSKPAIVEWYRLGNIRPSSDQLLKRRLFRLRLPLAKEIREDVAHMADDPITCGLHILDLQAFQVFAPELNRHLAQAERRILRYERKIDDLERSINETETRIVRKLQDGELDEERAAEAKEHIANAKAVLEEAKAVLKDEGSGGAQTSIDEARKHIAESESLSREWLQA